MSETKTESTLEIIATSIDRVLDKKCPICGKPTQNYLELGCVFVPNAAISCDTLARFFDDSNPEKKIYEAREKTLRALKHLLSAVL